MLEEQLGQVRKNFGTQIQLPLGQDTVTRHTKTPKVSNFLAYTRIIANQTYPKMVHISLFLIFLDLF